MYFYGAKTLKDNTPIDKIIKFKLPSEKEIDLKFSSVCIGNSSQSPIGNITVKASLGKYYTCYTAPFNCGLMLCGLGSNMTEDDLGVLEYIGRNTGMNCIVASCALSIYADDHTKELEDHLKRLEKNGWKTSYQKSNRNYAIILYGLRRIPNTLMVHRGH